MYLSVKPRPLSQCLAQDADGSSSGAGEAAATAAIELQHQSNSNAAAAAAPQKGWALGSIAGLKAEKGSWACTEDAALAVAALGLVDGTDKSAVVTQIADTIVKLRAAFEAQTKRVKAATCGKQTDVDIIMADCQKAAFGVMNPNRGLKDKQRSFDACLTSICGKPCQIQQKRLTGSMPYDAATPIEASSSLKDHGLEKGTKLVCFEMMQTVTGPVTGYQLAPKGNNIIHQAGISVSDLDAKIGIRPDEEMSLTAIVFSTLKGHVSVMVREISTGLWWHCDDANGYIYIRSGVGGLKAMPKLFAKMVTHLVYRKVGS